ncbi:MAG: GNAT family N-acetyltransferase [Ardenticatenales bacterium]|nr:GNAT family N-acetyltransferase [Ardenticatenales bacterium]
MRTTPVFAINYLREEDAAAVQQAAALLVAGFAGHWPGAWPDMASALAEVRECLAPEMICRAALAADGRVLGWIGGRPEYDGRVWELHPLVVDPAQQRQGIGRALVLDLEEQVRQRGGLTVLLGSDDEDGMTTLSGVDLYADLWQRIAQIRNLRGHPYSFYEKLGYAIVGVVPDANGWGKPDIIMAKRIV